MLELVKINKSYEIRKGKYQKVLHDLNLKFPNKGFVSILGSSGNGKTTLLNIIGGLDYKDSGQIIYDGEEINDYEAFRRERIGFVFQDFNLINHLNAIDNVIVGTPDDNKHKKENAIQILKDLGLESCLHKLPKEMSGGQRQRVAIARMIAKDVDIIICDEPTGSLDENTGTKIVEIIKELSKTKLILFVTHDQHIADHYSDKVIEIKNGQAYDTTEDCGFEFNDHQPHQKFFNSNVVWLAVKNVIGRYSHTIKHILLITFIMALTAIAIIVQGEFFTKYIHINAIDKGINTIIVDLDEASDYAAVKDELLKLDHVAYVNYDYDSLVDIAPSNYEQVRISTETRIENITGNDYYEESLIQGRMPESPNEVVMSVRGAMLMLKELIPNAQRIIDRYETGEIDSAYVYNLIDIKLFIIAEYGYPRMKIVGLISDDKVHELQHTLYIIDGFETLFEYPQGLHPNKLKIYKDDLYRNVNDSIIADLSTIEGVTLNYEHASKVDFAYNKLESFLDLSEITLYIIIGIALISLISLLFTSLFERKYEIGLYRSKGYNKKNIINILGLEMFFIGFISLALVFIMLIVSGIVMLYKVDYINSFLDAMKMINIGTITLALLIIITILVTAIINIGNAIILRKSILSNIKSL